ncbi:hypothetical protein K491DRAFT_720260 [Lophiostoma macrostomum CBS 122681]|uniref:Uncharacterized protein n=1 Tax=Lophiostoma macrostomum CBS 122681 TaxID=1314788 RepID=A0A6A6SWM7_9PLEO|nr:hypothetical protein K491DRAFT_720260 [Lophiostoma macrostomum CBS 122681]
MEIDGPRISLPGFGLPVKTLPLEWTQTNERSRFPHAIADFFPSKGVTLRELRMLNFMNQITDKPDWHKKVFDDAIVSKWKAEGVRWDDSLPEKGDWWLSERMFEACMSELQEKARLYEERGFVAVLDAEATIVKSDIAVSTGLTAALKREVRPLEDVPDQLKDWHPGSGDLVLDLVHPSLFPVVYGVTRVLPTGTVPLKKCVRYTGEGEIIPEFSPAAHEITGGWGSSEISFDKAWGSFQWLPTDIKFATADSPASIVSYVNNLHPQKHEGLYRVLGQFVDAAIPHWNECLSSFYSRYRIAIDHTSNEDYHIPEGISFSRNSESENGSNHSADGDGDAAGDDIEMSDEDWAWEHDAIDRYRAWQEEHRILKHPEPTFVSHANLESRPGYRPVNLRQKFADQGLQVIFKLANIHLTPEEPSYDGSSWHVEGSLNEHICATALYYYDSENVTDSHLQFRQSYDEESMVMKPAQSEFSSLEAFYGVTDQQSAVMDLGSVLTRQGRLLAFPNVLQHKVQPFELIDETKPGHRKILAMFLIDPHTRILSTANVPPQRRDWWAEEVRKAPPFSELPQEIFEMIVEFVEDFPISWESAEDYRETLMDERGAQNSDLEDRTESVNFYFCEH